MRMTTRRGPRSSRGTALVEMTIVLLLLILITLGAVEYGWMFLRQQQLTNAARQASRLASTPDATTAQVTSQISTVMTSYGMGSTGYTATFTPPDIATVPRGQSVKVQISVDYSKVTATNLTLLLPLPAKLSSTISMEKEGP
jgi:Flp pilus assembly protein TadG